MSSCATVTGVGITSADQPVLKHGFLEQLVRQHLARHDAAADLVTVCATPNGIASYVAGQVSAPVRSVRHEQGSVVTRVDSDEYGTLISVLGGPAVVEVCLHQSEAQRDAYRQAAAEVDLENREQALAAVQAAAVGMLRELGVTTHTDDDEEPTSD